MNPDLNNPTRLVRVWDPIVRGAHWTIATGVIANLTVLAENSLMHRVVGYIVIGALLARLYWGFAGTAYARFAGFAPTPRSLREYLQKLRARTEPRYLGHNPAGAAMMLTLMTLTLACAVTGWLSTADRFWGMEEFEDVHETLAYTIAALVMIHVAAAIFVSTRHRENLVWSMITGRKRTPYGSDIDNAARTD